MGEEPVADRLRRIDAFVVALALAFGVWNLFAIVAGWTVDLVVLLALPLASLLPFAWISFRVWRLSPHHSGSRLARAAFVTYLAIALLSLLPPLIAALLIVVRATNHTLWSLLPALTLFSVLQIAAEIAAGLLFSLGLLRTRLVPAWVAWLGLTGQVLLVVLRTTGFVLYVLGGSSPLNDMPFYVTRQIAQIAFLASLGAHPVLEALRVAGSGAVASHCGGHLTRASLVSLCPRGTPDDCQVGSDPAAV